MMEIENNEQVLLMQTEQTPGFTFQNNQNQIPFNCSEGYQVQIQSDGIIIFKKKQNDQYKQYKQYKLHAIKKYQTLACVTVYNQKSWDLERTIQGIVSSSKGIQGQKLIVVVFDGLQKMNDQKDPHCSTINFLQKKCQKFFEYCKIFKKKREKQQYLLKKKSQLLSKENGQLKKLNQFFQNKNKAFLIFEDKYKDENISHDFLFCVKIMNAGKLDSHKWYFKGFCQIANPLTCTIIDCSLQPLNNSLEIMHNQLTQDNKVGGVCGHMLLQEEFSPSNNHFSQTTDLVSSVLDKIFSIQSAQKCEYLIAHLLDKNFQSFFGFIQVLPGAFSSYRWRAITEHNNQYDILDQYFKDVNPKLQQNNQVYQILEWKNRLLAQDRILCLLLFCNNYTLKYLPECLAQVDSIMSCQTLLGQRRRWINGSIFALEYVLKNQDKYINQSQHNYASKLVFKLQIVINLYLKYLAYYSIGLYFSSYWVICNQSLNSWLPQQASLRGILFYLLVFIFILIYFGTFIESFTQDKTTLRRIYHTFAQWFGIFGISTALLTVLNLLSWIKIQITSNKQQLDRFYTQQGFQNNPLIFQVLFWLGIVNIILFAIPLVVFPIMEGKLVLIVEILVSIPHYLFYSPFMVVVMNIIAYSQLDNLSWGTKSIDSFAEDKKLSQKLKKLKWQISMKWMFRNCLLAIVLIIVSQFQGGRMFFMLVLLGINGLVLFIKVLFGFMYKVGHCFN